MENVNDNVTVIHKYPLSGRITLNSLGSNSALFLDERFNLIDEALDMDVTRAACEHEPIRYICQFGNVKKLNIGSFFRIQRLEK